jgi:hypothetical protein
MADGLHFVIFIHRAAEEPSKEDEFEDADAAPSGPRTLREATVLWSNLSRHLALHDAELLRAELRRREAAKGVEGSVHISVEGRRVHWKQTSCGDLFFCFLGV